MGENLITLAGEQEIADQSANLVHGISEIRIHDTEQASGDVTPDDAVSGCQPLQQTRGEAQAIQNNKLVVSLSKNNPKRIWDKKDHCIFCEKMVTNFTRHLSRIHAEELEVAKILALPKGSKDRKVMFEKLRKKGNFQHNRNCIRQGAGELIVVQRPSNKKNVSQFLPCKLCLGFFF